MNELERDPISAIRSDVANETNATPDAFTKDGTELFEREARKAKVSAAHDAQLAHGRMHERNERRIEWFEEQVRGKDSSIQSLTGELSVAKSELSKSKERAFWKQAIEFFAALMVAVGTGVRLVALRGGTDEFMLVTQHAWFVVGSTLSVVGAVVIALIAFRK